MANTKNRVLRVDEELWLAFGAACEAEGITKADDLRAHMRRKVRAYQRRQRQASGEDLAESGEKHTTED